MNLELITGFVQIFDPKFTTFFKTIISFSRLEVIKLLINTRLKKTLEKRFFHNALQMYIMGMIEKDLTKMENISLIKHLL